jgi:hypothetical protein
VPNYRFRFDGAQIGDRVIVTKNAAGSFDTVTDSTHRIANDPPSEDGYDSWSEGFDDGDEGGVR